MSTHKVGEEVFENETQMLAVMWWLLNLLGGQVTFPQDPQFWLDNFPADGSNYIAMRHDENGNAMLVAEKLPE